MENCVVCEKEFKAERKTAQYCGSTCRSVANRTDKVSVAKDNVTVYKCKGCEVVLEGNLKDLICMCHKCVNEGKKHKDYCDCVMDKTV